MRKRVIPFCHATSIHEVPAAFYLKLGIKTLLLDLDNTLDPYTDSSPSPKTVTWAKAMLDAGLSLIVTSNNRGGRVNTYCAVLGIECAHLMAKPFSFRIKKLLKDKGLSTNETMLIGDQIETDVKAGNGAHIRVMLTEPIDTEHEPFTTRINRIFDRPTRAKLLRRGYLKDWRDIHE